MDGGMMVGMGIWWLVILVLVILAILALVKYLRKECAHLWLHFPHSVRCDDESFTRLSRRAAPRRQAGQGRARRPSAG